MDRAYIQGIVIFDDLKQLARPIHVNPLRPEHIIVPFTQRVVATLETNTSSALMLDDEIIKEYDTFNDFFGFLTSTKDSWDRTNPTPPVIYENIVEFKINYYAKSGYYYHIPSDWYEIGVGAPDANSIEAMEKWFNNVQYVRNDDGEYVPVMTPPESIKEHTVATARYNSNMTIDERLEQIKNVVDDLRKLYSEEINEKMLTSFNTLVNYAHNPE